MRLRLFLRRSCRIFAWFLHLLHFSLNANAFGSISGFPFHLIFIFNANFRHSISPRPKFFVHAPFHTCANTNFAFSARSPKPSYSPTPTPTTPTNSPSSSPTPIPSNSPSNSPTPTPTPSNSPTPTPTPTPSNSPKPSYTPTPTPTPTPSNSPTPTPTPTPTPSISPSPSSSTSKTAALSGKVIVGTILGVVILLILFWIFILIKRKKARYFVPIGTINETLFESFSDDGFEQDSDSKKKYDDINNDNENERNYSGSESSEFKNRFSNF
ncbi:paired immunoglobulin-like type 2 receptor [Anaeramoeba ignava]|uniref:Paired immunoglobulin-like type 2 receptor n=1 Tax=Anaeramoeba ignava TaxID=1746090 RepID=A0A9Q0LAE3_ANAIG|nr:paired immunoglobulin-like type 2 receptor [Anaeramoeba ignava]